MSKAKVVRLPGKAATVQARLLTFLRDPRSYPERVHRIRILQTHASIVALTERRAYKVKKPVDFGFLDFSTLEKRRHFCEREVALNRRLCPGVHLGLVPISLRRGRLEFGSAGEVVEYAVKMRRLRERDSLLWRIARGKVMARDVSAVVATLVSFYEQQAPTPEITEWGRTKKLHISTNENFRQMAEFVGHTISRPAFEAIRIFTDTFYRRHASLFAARVREHRIRDCHGDLHLDHIFRSPEGLIIYDCIEFNDRLRYLDVANDAAFLAMDFDFHGRRDLSGHFATRLAQGLDDRGLLRLLDFYKCYRACVRGKVESYHSLAAHVPEPEQRESRLRAERYFQLSLQYAVCGLRPMALVLTGRVGSGKSTLARALGRELGWEVFSSDHVRKELAGVPLYVRGGAKQRRRLYAKAMTDRTYAALTRLALGHLRAHRGVILDATFSERSRRDTLRRALERAGVAYCVIETQAAKATLQRRLAARSRATTEISDARVDDFSMLDDRYDPPFEVDARYFFAVKTGTTTESVAVATLKNLAQRHARRAGAETTHD